MRAMLSIRTGCPTGRDGELADGPDAALARGRGFSPGIVAGFTIVESPSSLGHHQAQGLPTVAMDAQAGRARRSTAT